MHPSHPSIHPFLRVNHPSRRVNEFSNEEIHPKKGWTRSPLRVNHPSWRVLHPFEGWITLLKGEWTRRVNKIRVNEEWSTLPKGELEKGVSEKGEWRVKHLSEGCIGQYININSWIVQSCLILLDIAGSCWILLNLLELA
jgi:hypothetical protein